MGAAVDDRRLVAEEGGTDYVPPGVLRELDAGRTTEEFTGEAPRAE
jgi:hypothetical protein